ncbi:MAG: M3 family metallopeptidase [Candidatus Shapirobacteria bacterium]|jgi:oligoendopeptidase F
MTGWQLDDILRVKDFEKLYRQIEKEVGQILAWEKRMDPKMPKRIFRKWIEFEETLDEELARLNYLPYLILSVDQNNELARIFKARADSLTVKADEKGRKIRHWIKGLVKINGKTLGKADAERLFGAVPDMKYKLGYARDTAKFTKNEEEENILANKDINGMEALRDLRTMLETEQVYEMKVGEKKALKVKTTAEIIRMTRDNKAEVREAAYRALLGKYKENADKYFLIYKSRVKDWKYETKLRGFKEAIDRRNWGNEINGKIVESMMGTVKDNRKVFHDYFEIKAKMLKVKKMKRWDVYAPIYQVQKSPPGADQPVAENIKNQKFEQVEKEVVDGLYEFSESFGEGAERIIREKHVDSLPNPKKRGGAFCATVSPKITPYVMLNFSGQSRDIKTLAHELGHGIHSLMANKHHIGNQSASLVLAETASTLAEVAITEKMIERAGKKQEKLALMAERMEDAWATIARQTGVVLFEKEIYEKIEEAGTTMANKLWLRCLDEQFGEAVEVDNLFQYEWAYIPHIVQSPFYCYAYSFGELLAIGLYGRYKRDRSYLKEINKILASGGSLAPETILRNSGVDIDRPEFWQEGFNEIRKWLKETREMIE